MSRSWCLEMCELNSSFLRWNDPLITCPLPPRVDEIDDDGKLLTFRPSRVRTGV